ncbi:hypothetical protein O181_035739 [Austropuccinia psidii MF-1]|uniref:Transmembrane protein n=1 Tax=Austropuccinia psidii MF-1 TaxID=1389203 RepID=A0A9Q3D382_9BASI|nr:hypothetical protein [Austropuccinia psidii MF-1]
MSIQTNSSFYLTLHEQSASRPSSTTPLNLSENWAKRAKINHGTSSSKTPNILRKKIKKLSLFKYYVITNPLIFFIIAVNFISTNCDLSLYLVWRSINKSCEIRLYLALLSQKGTKPVAFSATRYKSPSSPMKEGNTLELTLILFVITFVSFPPIKLFITFFLSYLSHFQL